MTTCSSKLANVIAGLNAGFDELTSNKDELVKINAVIRKVNKARNDLQWLYFELRHKAEELRIKNGR